MKNKWRVGVLLLVALHALLSPHSAWAQSTRVPAPDPRAATVEAAPAAAALPPLAPEATARFVTQGGKTYQIDANGRVIGIYHGRADVRALNANLAKRGPELLRASPGRVSTPGAGYSQAAALQASVATSFVAPGPLNPNVGITTGTPSNAGAITTMDQNLMINGLAVGPAGQFFYPGNAAGYLSSPLFPIPGNLTVGTPAPGQVQMPTSSLSVGPGVTSSFAPGGTVAPGGYFVPAYNGVFYNAATYYNAGNVPITTTTAPLSTVPTGLTGATTTTGLGGAPAPFLGAPGLTTTTPAALTGTGR